VTYLHREPVDVERGGERRAHVEQTGVRPEELVRRAREQVAAEPADVDLRVRR